jgi:hypothetical protein
LDLLLGYIHLMTVAASGVISSAINSSLTESIPPLIPSLKFRRYWEFGLIEDSFWESKSLTLVQELNREYWMTLLEAQRPVLARRLGRFIRRTPAGNTEGEGR